MNPGFNMQTDDGLNGGFVNPGGGGLNTASSNQNQYQQNNSNHGNRRMNLRPNNNQNIVYNQEIGANQQNKQPVQNNQWHVNNPQHNYQSQSGPNPRSNQQPQQPPAPFYNQNQNYPNQQYNDYRQPHFNYNQGQSQKNPGNFQNQQTAEENWEEEHRQEIETEKYYTNTFIVGIVAIVLYYLGSFLIIFVNNVGGETIVNLPTYEISWQLLFSNPFEYIRNIFLSVFGYFFQYARLYGFFPDLGDLVLEPYPKYLMPVDIAIKLIAILYFNFGWMPWDTKRFFNRGALNNKYPYLTDGEKTEKKYKKVEQENSPIASINIPASELERRQQEEVIKAKQQENYNRYNNYNQDDDDDDGEDEGLIPFSGVQKPLEEWYLRNEEVFYTFIRRRLLPGSNLVLALYFSTLNVLDISRNPLDVLLYILGIMSMFWCMQSFLLVLDHVHYPPEEDLEEAK